MRKISPEKFFIYCALIFGILFIALIPPFQSPDEDSHFKKAYVVSKFRLYPTEQNGVVGYKLPNEMINYINNKLQFIGKTDQKYTYRDLILDDRLPKNYEEQTFQNFSTAEITPIAYLAPAIGIIFGKIMNFLIGIHNTSFVNLLYFARLFSLILYITIVYISIKTTPILKKTFCLIGLLPMTFTLAVAISYDSVLISVALYATALILKLIFDDSVKEVSYKHIIILGIIGFILLSLKTIYISVMIPLLLIPKYKYGGNIKSVIKKLSMIIGIAVGIYFLNKLPTIFLEKAPNIEHESFINQINFVLSNPIYYLKIWMHSMIYNRSFYIAGMFGIFGLLDTYVQTIYTAIYIIAFIGVILADVSLEEKKFNWKYKLLSLIAIIASIFGIFLALYIVWTSIIDGYGIGASEITGVQGRYFIPLLPLGIVLLSNSILTKNEKIKNILTNILDNCYIVCFISLLVTSLTVLLRFWI